MKLPQKNLPEFSFNDLGIVSTIAGNKGGFADGGKDMAQFYYPWGVTVDRIGNIYVADYSNNRIRKVNNKGMIYLNFIQVQMNCALINNCKIFYRGGEHICKKWSCRLCRWNCYSIHVQ